MRIPSVIFSLLLLTLGVSCTHSTAARKPTQDSQIQVIEVSSESTAATQPAKPPFTQDELTVISWNIKHLGRDSLDLAAAAELLTRADIVTFQEVNQNQKGQAALFQIAQRIARDSQTKMCWALSEFPTGDRRERYAYIWRNDRVSYVRTDGTVIEDCPQTAMTVRLGSKHEAEIVREPAVGIFLFKHTRVKFVLASIHLVPTEKKPEFEVAPLFSTFDSVRGPVIVAGDYNLDSDAQAFSAASARGFTPALVGVKTSLKINVRELSKAYDNFWYREAKLVRRSVLNLHDAFPNRDAKTIYNGISDHNPIQASFTFAQP